MIEETLQDHPLRPVMSDDDKVRDFQRKIYRKAKQDKTFRFYVLYDKVRLGHFLNEAYRRVKRSAGSPGVDGLTFEDIERQGVEDFLKGIQNELAGRTYKPEPVLRVLIPKENGKMRPLGIPTIRDRVVQMSCKMVIEPIFEADFEDTSYGFRPRRSAEQAVGKVKEGLKEGLTEVYDADLSSCFDTIPHDKLLTLIGKRISDRNIIHLIKLWLKAPVKDDDGITGGKGSKTGTPQGGVISPLLANIYLNLIDKMVCNAKLVFVRSGVTIVRYADDFILMGRQISEEVLTKLREILALMELSINEEKSRKILATENPFDFLGFTFHRVNDLHGPGKYWDVRPSAKSQRKIRRNIDVKLRKTGHYAPRQVASAINLIVRGWLNYFDIKGVSYTRKPRRRLRWYLTERLHRYYRRKSQRKCVWARGNLFERMTQHYGLIDPTKYGAVAVNV